MGKITRLTILAGLIIPALSLADVVGPPSIHSLIQNGQNVEVGLTWSDEYDLQFPVSLTRISNHQELDIIEERVFLKEEAVSSEVYCYGPDNQALCEEDPDNCYDCDGDDILECWEYPCKTKFRFEVIDECAPPGYTTYKVINLAFEMSSQDHLDVEDTGDECLGSDDCSAVAPGIQSVLFKIIALFRLL